MPRAPSSSSVRHMPATSPLGRELRTASRRELATLKRDLKDKHRERMKRVRGKEAVDRRTKVVVAAVEVGGTAAVAGMARQYLGDKLDVGPIPLELPLAIAGHMVGGYFYPDDEAGEHAHNISNGLLAVAAFQGSQRMTAWARERMRRSNESPPVAAPPTATAQGAYPPTAYAGALPPPPSLALPPPPLPGPPVYAQPMAVAGAAPALTSADRAMSEAIRVMESARHD